MDNGGIDILSTNVDMDKIGNKIGYHKEKPNGKEKFRCMDITKTEGKNKDYLYLQTVKRLLK